MSAACILCLANYLQNEETPHNKAGLDMEELLLLPRRLRFASA